MMKVLLAGGTGVAAVAAVPLLAILAVLGTGAGCGLSNAADVPARARPWIAATHAACPDLPEPWIAAVMAQESSFDPDAHADDVNGGTWGLFQLNAAAWNAAYGAGWDADRDRDGIPDVREPAIHARVAGEHLCARLAGVRALRAAHPEWPSTRDLSELDALVIAHNAGESRLASYPDLPAVTARYLRDVASRIGDWTSCPRVGLAFDVPAGTDPRVADAIRTAVSLVGQTGWYRRCDRLACRAYGYATSGYPTAAAHWQSLLAGGYVHPGDRCPPPGTFAYWDTGEPGPQDGQGHVALVVASDPMCAPERTLVVSNDVGDAGAGARGGVYLVTLADLESGFMSSDRYLGWSPPVCAGAPAALLVSTN
jgi:hypothetical protein